jgi:hypothetical protein
MNAFVRVEPSDGTIAGIDVGSQVNRDFSVIMA